MYYYEWYTAFVVFDWRGENLVSLCEQDRRCGVVRQLLLNILSSLKARLGTFWREKS